MSNSNIINDGNPLKIVLLGAPCVGKSTFANRLHSKFFRETYYPTHKSTALLFDYQANSSKTCTILDEYGGLEAKQIIMKQNDILLSPTIFQSYNITTQAKKRRVSTSSSSTRLIHNSLYSYEFSDEAVDQSYKEPSISPIQVELIDTPAFKPHLVVPFLEVSLYRNLDREDLYNLANEPRRPVSTNPLLVASGASELNGNVEGYLFMYCAVPSLNPPSYDDSLTTSAIGDDSNELNPVTSGNNNLSPKSSRLEDSLSVLEIIRGAIFDAWREFRNYEKKKKKGKEGDVYSIIYGIKQLWKMKTLEEEQRKLEELRKISSHLEDLNIDPSSPDSPPPIVIVCTHAKHEGVSPVLIDQGKKMANDWNCSFILIDNEFDENVEEALALIIREIVEREKLQKKKKSGV